MATSPKEQILKIYPQNELKFVGPFTSPTMSYITLENPTDKKVCFKIKTTAPKKYCVRPNAGVMKPKCSQQVAVVLQPASFDVNEKNKHKFMVQTLVAPEGPFQFDSVWKDVHPGNVVEYKLKCVFQLNDTEDENNDDNEKKPAAVVSQSPDNNDDRELAKAANEVKSLREEESNLRLENMQLKEELLRLRHANPGSQSRLFTDPSRQTATLPQSYPITVIVLGIIFGLVGVIIGKYLM